MSMTPQVADASQTRNTPHRRRLLAWVLLGVALVLVTTLVVVQVRAQRAQAALDAQETSAWEDRIELDRALVDTAAHLGIDGEVEEQQETSLTCTRNDGREGFSYFLHPVGSDDPPEVDALLGEATQYWQDLGYTVNTRQIGDARGIEALTPHGAVLEVIAGPGGVTITGETGCALTDGAPGSEDAAD